jgi:SAM-dependent methyltransferase
MGISSPMIRLIAQALKDRAAGNCITLGVQGVQGRYADIRNILMQESLNFCELDESEIKYDNKTQYGNSLHQDTLFKMLGFSKVDSLDYFPNENPTHVADLNVPVPELYNQYDMVFDGGTLEHCFNVKQVFSNIVNLVKVGGIILHAVPMNGWVGHGFYQFSPGLFFDFYDANGFINLHAKIVIYGRKSYYLDYDPELISIFNKMKKTTLIFFSAQKNIELPSIQDAIQSRYLQSFGGHHKENTNISRKQYILNIFNKLPQNFLTSMLYRAALKSYNLAKVIRVYRTMVKL